MRWVPSFVLGPVPSFGQGIWSGERMMERVVRLRVAKPGPARAHARRLHAERARSLEAETEVALLARPGGRYRVVAPGGRDRTRCRVLGLVAPFERVPDPTRESPGLRDRVAQAGGARRGRARSHGGGVDTRRIGA